MSKLSGEGSSDCSSLRDVVYGDLPESRVWSSDLKISRYLVSHLIESKGICFRERIIKN